MSRWLVCVSVVVFLYQNVDVLTPAGSKPGKCCTCTTCHSMKEKAVIAVELFIYLFTYLLAHFYQAACRSGTAGCSFVRKFIKARVHGTATACC